MRCSLLHRGGLFYHPNDNGKEVQYYSLKASMEQSFLLVTRDEQEQSTEVVMDCFLGAF